MSDLPLSLPKKARQRHPYGSLYAALLFQSFQDAIAEATSENAPGIRDEAAPKKRRGAAASRSTLLPQA